MTLYYVLNTIGILLSIVFFVLTQQFIYPFLTKISLNSKTSPFIYAVGIILLITVWSLFFLALTICMIWLMAAFEIGEWRMLVNQNYILNIFFLFLPIALLQNLRKKIYSQYLTSQHNLTKCTSILHSFINYFFILYIILDKWTSNHMFPYASLIQNKQLSIQTNAFFTDNFYIYLQTFLVKYGLFFIIDVLIIYIENMKDSGANNKKKH